MEAPARAPKYLYLQVLRALAAMAVLFHNTNFAQHETTGRSNLFLPAASLGEVGVDLFFVLSGFLMVRTTLSTPAGLSGAARFLTARAVRIYPVYWLVALTWAAACMIWPGLGGPSPTSPPWAGLLLLPTGLQPQLHQAWSLVFEVYFYLVFGLVLLSRRRSVLLGLWGAWLLACAATGLRLPTPFGDMLSNPLALEFLMGCLVAHAPLERMRNPLLMLVAGLMILPFGEYFRFHLAVVDPGSEIWRVVMVGLPAAAVLMGLTGVEARRRTPPPAWLSAIGDRSYALYLVNDPIAMGFMAAMTGLVAAGPRPMVDAIYIAGVLAASLLAAEIAHRLAERPSMRLSRALRSSRPAPGEVLRRAA